MIIHCFKRPESPSTLALISWGVPSKQTDVSSFVLIKPPSTLLFGFCDHSVVIEKNRTKKVKKTKVDLGFLSVVLKFISYKILL